jgi:hypothetical protein
MSESDEFKHATQGLLEEVAAPVYRALGRTLMKWQFVETGMFLLVHAILRCDYKYSSSVFYMLTGGNMKLQLLNRLSEAHFSEDDIKNHWTPTYKDLQKAMAFRNGLAHFEINFIHNPQGLRPGDPPIVLTPHHTDVRESKKPLVKAVFLTELNQAADFYVKLANRLVSLVQHHFSPEELRATQLPHQLIQMLTKPPNTQDNPPPPPQQP